MIGIALCIAAFLLAFLAGRRSLCAGLSAVLSIGYFYGILRANFPAASSHFIFDSAVLALYATQLFNGQSLAERLRTRSIFIWTAVLMAWPVVMLCLPFQDPLVELVGLRGNIFLLPFLILGARLKQKDIARLALTLAVLNLISFSLAAGEYIFGLERFFPHNEVTDLIYRSSDVGSEGSTRIPGPFSGSHAYAGTMVLSLPFLLAAWAIAGTSFARRLVLISAIGAATLGVFAAASRVHTLVLAAVVIGTFFSGRVSAGARVVIVSAIAALAAIVLSQERLQRFTTLSDTNYVQSRIGGSVNTGFLDVLMDYPLGNGLGGGGTSMPYFLQSRLRGVVKLENEYARILLEQTSIGLCLWLSFIAWFITRRFTAAHKYWGLGEHTAWIACVAYFGTALIGIGLLTAIPQSALIFLCIGWVATKRAEPEQQQEIIYEFVEVPAHA